MEGISLVMERYLEAIYELEKEYGSASVTDIAKKRAVKASSVTYMLKKLQEKDMISYRKHRSVTLTPLGMKFAKKLEKTHQTLKWFFMLLGVDDKTADADACEIEHHIHPQTMKHLMKFAEWVSAAHETPRWLDHFYEFRDTGKRSIQCTQECDGESK
jgi:DtxR family Mn-dependent transcriptional regulator